MCYLETCTLCKANCFKDQQCLNLKLWKKTIFLCGSLRRLLKVTPFSIFKDITLCRQRQLAPSLVVCYIYRYSSARPELSPPMSWIHSKCVKRDSKADPSSIDCLAVPSILQSNRNKQIAKSETLHTNKSSRRKYSIRRCTFVSAALKVGPLRRKDMYIRNLASSP